MFEFKSAIKVHWTVEMNAKNWKFVLENHQVTNRVNIEDIIPPALIFCTYIYWIIDFYVDSLEKNVNY